MRSLVAANPELDAAGPPNWALDESPAQAIARVMAILAGQLRDAAAAYREVIDVVHASALPKDIPF